MKKVAFLFDKDNDWLEPHFRPYIQSIKNWTTFTTYETSDLKNFDIVVVLGMTKILSENVLRSNNLCVTIHESALPKGRGFAPLQWQILHGQSEIPISLIKLAHPVDSGNIIYTHQLNLNGFELYDELRCLQARTSIKLVEKLLFNYPNYPEEKQRGHASFYRRRTPEDQELDINKTIVDQFNILRISNNDSWPAFFYISGKKYIIKIFSE